MRTTYMIPFVLLLLMEDTGVYFTHAKFAGLSTVELGKRDGYSIKEYKNVRTPDGYLLVLHRIPYGTAATKSSKQRPVVFLMHGLYYNSVIWVSMGPTLSLGYVLADAGYDVWMGNARGTTYCRNHVSYNSSKDAEYWQFSWHEIGTIDLPTMIDFVLQETGQKKLYYVGHSQGTTTFFVMLSELPRYNDKISLMIALAPVAFLSHTTSSWIRFLANHYLLLQWLSNWVWIGECFPSETVRDYISSSACTDDAKTDNICIEAAFRLSGSDPAQFNSSTLQMILNAFPAGSSCMQLVHYAQLITSGKFLKYDHGYSENMRKYNSHKPPLYNLSRVTAPVALFRGPNDIFGELTDFKLLAKRLPNVVLNYTIPRKTFAHFDFLFAADLKELVNDRILDLLKIY